VIGLVLKLLLVIEYYKSSVAFFSPLLNPNHYYPPSTILSSLHLPTYSRNDTIPAAAVVCRAGHNDDDTSTAPMQQQRREEEEEAVPQ
jgi:hypothetical protein